MRPGYKGALALALMLALALVGLAGSGNDLSKEADEGVPIKLVVYPGAYHGFDASNLKTPIQLLGHHLEFNQSATDQSIGELRGFLGATIGSREQDN